MKVRKVPIRMCVGCKSKKPKRELIRITQPKEGDLHTDPTGKAHGRGSYICANIECLQAAIKAKHIKADSEIIDALKAEIDKRA